MLCPECGSEIRPNKGWAAQFYDGYCNQCYMPVGNGVPEKLYTCEYCGHEMAWDAHDEEHGDMWSCEVDGCDKVFCTRCFIARHGYMKWQKMMGYSPRIIMCPEHYAQYEGGTRNE